QCLVSPTDLTFGSVATGSFLDKNFTITNAGGGTLSGNVSENCNFFSLVSGGGVFNIPGGGSITVTVRFSPTVVGFGHCGVGTGNLGCTNVTATGTGAQPTACQVSPLSIDFGTVALGSSSDKTVT